MRGRGTRGRYESREGPERDAGKGERRAGAAGTRASPGSPADARSSPSLRRAGARDRAGTAGLGQLEATASETRTTAALRGLGQ